MPKAFWPGNKCGNCNHQSKDPLEKLTCEGEQAGVECCRMCGFGPEAPVGLRVTRAYLQSKIAATRTRVQ